MNLKDVATGRLSSQQIAETSFQSVKDLVSWMGVMQAQDFPMAKWAVGIRLPGSTLKQVNAAIDTGEIIRTHLLRPTWHFVSADDIYWMLELSAGRIRTAARSHMKELEISDTILSKSYSIIEKLLQGGQHRSREDIMAELLRNNIQTNENRSSLILMQAEMAGLVCSGASLGNKQTYALLEERVPRPPALSKEEALARLASRYFYSHCPATLQDFTWWSGLTAGDARQALQLVQDDLISETIGSQTFWMPGTFMIPEKRKRPSVHLLPAFDEFVISYADRSAILTRENHRRSVSRNGLFRPVIVVNGQVTGLWKRTIAGDNLNIQTGFFEVHSNTLRNSIASAAKNLGRFMSLKPVINFETESEEFK